ncbi:ATP-binding protein [Paraliomyxa miuraensis]|uniref:ATP-binding protein n=1 Tax=Paraliomyxa miuraensis TaxID=376150 RepID=UPI00224E28DF|nr:ATP-binding protein [Paraliomyxa miuraensis]MCX4244488.1 ATP-binding protein [Paraliomyxa miuraensis]
MPRLRPIRDWPLSLKLATTVLLLAVIPTLLAAYLNAREVESQSFVRETQSLQRSSAAAARRLEERVGRLRAYVELVAQNPTILAAVPDLSDAPTPQAQARAWDARHPEIYALLVSLRRANPWFENVYLLDPAGVCIATSERATKPEMVGRPYDYRPYFQAALENRAPFVSDVLKNATSPGTGIFVSAPVLRDDAVVGVVVLKVQSGALHEVVADLARTSGSAMLVDRFGVVVSDAWTGTLRDTEDPQSLQFHPLASVARFQTLFEQTRRYGTREGEHYLDRVQDPLPLDPLWTALQQRRSGAAEHAFPSAFGQTPIPTMVGYAPVMSSGDEPYGYVLLGEPAADFRGPLHEIAESALLRSGLVAFGVALVIALLIRRFSRQIVDLAAHARRLADGEPTEPLRLPRDDELGVLATSVERLAEQMRQAVRAEHDARARSDHARDLAEAVAKARTEAVARAHAVLDGARAAIDEATELAPRGNLRRVSAQLQGTALDLAALANADGTLRPKPRRVVLTSLVQELVDAQDHDPERPVTVVADAALETELEVQTDPAMLRRLLEHLVDNACKFTRRGKVEVRISRDGDRIRLAIADTGIGLTARQASRISTQGEEPVGDSGVGLWVARRLARALGAALDAQGEVGRGSTVTVELPAPAPS